jgi:epoxyqueuosine reductase
MRAHELGFELVGVAPATPADGFDRLRDWLDRGCAGEMAYMERTAEARKDPSSILANVRSVIMVGMSYATNEGSSNAGRGLPVSESSSIPFPAQIARYARGPDYHTILWRKLDQLLEWLQQQLPDCQGRSVVDTAPLLERGFARRAGLGWFGKNTMLINKRHGSYLYLGALLVDVELKTDSPHYSSHCGTCTACLDACPTQAFTAPGWLDARRCISYLTIELRTPIPEELRARVGSWAFGCDICQEVCPWNSKVESEFAAVDPLELLGLSEEGFRQRFRGTAITRTKRRGLLRNAAIVLGNVADKTALPALRQAAKDPEPLVQEAASWAIARILERCRQSNDPDIDFQVAKTPANF